MLSLLPQGGLATWCLVGQSAGRTHRVFVDDGVAAVKARATMAAVVGAAKARATMVAGVGAGRRRLGRRRARRRRWRRFGRD